MSSRTYEKPRHIGRIGGALGGVVDPPLSICGRKRKHIVNAVLLLLTPAATRGNNDVGIINS